MRVYRGRRHYYIARLYTYIERFLIPTAIVVGNLYGASAERIVLSVSSARARARGVIIAARSNTMDRCRQWTLVVCPVIAGFVRLRFIGMVMVYTRSHPLRRPLIVDTSAPGTPPPVRQPLPLRPRGHNRSYGFCTFLYLYPGYREGYINRANNKIP